LPHILRTSRDRMPIGRIPGLSLKGRTGWQRV
jgi:hypothetical protein